MKFILLLPAILFAGSCLAQETGTPPSFLKPQKSGRLKKIVVLKDGTVLTDLEKAKLLINPGSPLILESPSNPQVLVSPGTPQAKYLGTLPNGNSAFALPQDNMPCVVPNENATTPMPNVTGVPTLPYRYLGPGAIPNPAVPLLNKKANEEISLIKNPSAGAKGFQYFGS